MTNLLSMLCCRYGCGEGRDFKRRWCRCVYLCENFSVHLSRDDACHLSDIFLLEYHWEQFGNTENACIDTRVELAKCYNGVDDVRKCDGFVEALERCANQAVISS